MAPKASPHTFITATLLLSLVLQLMPVWAGKVSAVDKVSKPTKVPEEAFECHRESPLTDWCMLKGDVRVDLVGGAVMLNAKNGATPRGRLEVKPYPRKWDYPIMGTISKVHLQSVDEQVLEKVKAEGGNVQLLQCTRHIDVPAILLSVGGYSGDILHDFNEVLLPLFQTVQEYHREVVLILSDFKGDWWFRAPVNGSIIATMTKYPIRVFGAPEDTLGNKQEVECYSNLIVGLKHNLCMYDEWGGRQERDEVRAGVKVREFAMRICKAMGLRAWSWEPDSNEVNIEAGQKPVLGLIQRRNTGRFMNFEVLVKAAQDMGFKVKELEFDTIVELKKLIPDVRGLDAIVGVHGSELAHTLFMRTRSVIMQIMPFGTYGEKTVVGRVYKNIAESLAASYMEWHVPREHSSLFTQFNESEPILAHPESFWEEDLLTAQRLYHGQDVSIPPMTFRMILRHILHTLGMQRGITAKYPGSEHANPTNNEQDSVG